MTTLTPADRRAFVEDGYLVMRNGLDPVRIDAFLDDMHRIVDAQLVPADRAGEASPDLLAAIYAGMTALHRRDQGRYLAVLRVLNKCRSLYDLFLAEPIANACRELGVAMPLMHTLPIFHVMSHRLVIDGGYHGFAAHQDWSGLQTSLNAVVVWVPLHDIDGNRFPLEVLPGSHRQGLCPGSVRDNEFVLDDSCVAGRDFHRVQVRAGDVVFMSPFTIHRSGLSETDDLRLAVSWRYEDALEPTFIDRGYPFAQARVVSHGLIVPEFPSARQLEAALERLAVRSGASGPRRT